MPLDVLIKYNNLNFMYDYTYGNLPDGFDTTWQMRKTLNPEVVLRNSIDYHIPRLRYAYSMRLPLLLFPKTWNELNDELKVLVPRKCIMSNLKSYLIDVIT